MIMRCKECGYEGEYTAAPCPICGSEPNISMDDFEVTARELEIALSDKNIGRIFSCRHLLADLGDTESEREYAKMLERGEYQLRDIDKAMEYYHRAAKKNDPYSAFRYSRLVDRTSLIASNFWLKYAAVLGCIDSYPEASEMFSREGREDIAAYYCSLAAQYDDTDSIVNMAKRWHEGIGVTQNDCYAKWYLDKMVIPPISFIKLAYKLRGVRSETPEELTFPQYDKYLKALSEEANKYSFDTAYYNLTCMLANNGDLNAETAVGLMLLLGKGCVKKVEAAKNALEAAISHGSSAAAIYIGEEYLKGENLPQSTDMALRYYSKAASLGYTDAYEKIGDIYHDGALVEKDIAKAVELYELAAAGGSKSAKLKADTLKEKRLDFYLEGYRIITSKTPVTKDEAFTAFRSFAIATAMGEGRAPRYLAMCYAYGFGTEKDRQGAYFWYKHAVECGDKEAYIPLALCYSNGFGIAFSYKDAIKYLKLAKGAGIPGADAELEKLYSKKIRKMVRQLYSTSMRLIYQKKFTEAVGLLSSFESLGYPKALYTLGCLYEFGRGVEKSDRACADKYYELAYVGNPLYGNFADPNSEYKLIVLKMIR